MLTNLTEISPIGLGTGTGFRKVDEKTDLELTHLLQRALDLGISLIDTAEIYFDGHAEELIGKVFKKNREKIYIATKFSPEHSGYKDVLEAAGGSLGRLKTDYIDLYQVHWPNPTIPIEDTLKALEKLVKDGKVRHIGVCNFSLRQLKDIQKKSRLPILSLQTEYNLLERSIEKELLPYCQKNNITTIAYTPLNSGNILKDKKYLKVLTRLSKKYKKSVSQIILNFLISHPGVVAIPATTNLEHLEENAKSIEFTLEEKDIQLIAKTFASKLMDIDTSEIKVASLEDHAAYKTVEEALANKLNFFPSPESLSNDIKKGDFLKPVKLKVLKKDANFKYELIGGRIRFWAWVIAFNGKKPIPAIIEN